MGTVAFAVWLEVCSRLHKLSVALLSSALLKRHIARGWLGCGLTQGESLLCRGTEALGAAGGPRDCLEPSTEKSRAAQVKWRQATEQAWGTARS